MAEAVAGDVPGPLAAFDAPHCVFAGLHSVRVDACAGECTQVRWRVESGRCRDIGVAVHDAASLR